MKTFQSIKHNPNKIAGLISTLAILFLLTACGPMVVTERTVVRQEVAPPPWAPAYDNVQDVQYYYLPDVEMYYDVWHHQYVYYNMGTWVYTTSIPSYCAGYNINEAFVVVLDRGVRDPWRHHHTYVSSYPKYYYRSQYRDWNERSGNGPMRGYNENARNVIYHSDRTNTRNNRSEQVVREPQSNRSTQLQSQPQHDRYQRTYPSTSSQPQQTQNNSRRDSYTPPSNNNAPNTNNQSAPVTRRDTYQPSPSNTNTQPASTPVTRRDTYQPSNSSNSSAPVYRRQESTPPAASTPVRTERSAPAPAAQESRRSTTESSKPAERSSGNSDSKKKDEGVTTRSRR